jgi:acetoin utilization protein AcuB
MRNTAQAHRASRKEFSMATTGTVGKYDWIKVVDVMTPNPITVSAEDTVGQAEELMGRNNIRQLPVVNKRELIGIISDRDIRSFLSSTLLSTTEDRDRALNTAVREVMTTNPIALAPDDELQDAVETLIEEKVGGIPVVDEAEGLVGIVTYVDMLRCFLNRLQEE